MTVVKSQNSYFLTLFITFVYVESFTIKNACLNKTPKKTFQGFRFVFKVDTLTVTVNIAILVFI